MSTRYFTVKEANALLPELKPLMSQLLDKRAKVVRMSQDAGDILEDYRSNIGGPLLADMVKDFETIERLIEQIQTYGCVLKGLNAGLIDFLAQRNGRDVYLCWRFGEDQIEHFHELHTGYNNRRPI